MSGSFGSVEKSALENRVKELGEMIATRNTEAEKVAKDAAVRDEQFVDHVAFRDQNVRGKYSLCLSCTAVFPRLIMLYLYFSLCDFYRSSWRSCTCKLIG